jgi:hypothetical protein
LTWVCYHKIMIKPKVVIMFIVVILLAAGGAYYFGYQQGYGKGAEAEVGAEGAVEAPLGEMPSTNPFDQAVNPFKDLYKNPFK